MLKLSFPPSIFKFEAGPISFWFSLQLPGLSKYWSVLPHSFKRFWTAADLFFAESLLLLLWFLLSQGLECASAFVLFNENKALTLERCISCSHLPSAILRDPKASSRANALWKPDQCLTAERFTHKWMMYIYWHKHPWGQISIVWPWVFNMQSYIFAH